MMERQVSFMVLEEGVQVTESLDGEVEVVYMSFGEIAVLLEKVKENMSLSLLDCTNTCDRK